MKKIIHKTLHWLNVGIITLVLLLATLLLALHFDNTYLEKYRQDIEGFASKSIHQPVTIGTIGIGYHGLEPVFRLHDVVIFDDAKTKKILQAHELQIGIDITGSLIKWQIRPGIILLKGSEIEIDQKQIAKISREDLIDPTTDKPKTSNDKLNIPKEISSWLLEQSKIYLENITLKWHLANGNEINIKDLSLKLDNDIFRKNIRISGKLVQKKSPATFITNLKLHNDFFKQPLSSVKGNLTITNLHHVFNQDKPLGNIPLIPPAGEIDLLVKNSSFKANLFRQALPIKTISSKVTWKHDKDNSEINIDNIKFIDDWLNIKGHSQLTFLNDSSWPVADIQLISEFKNLAKAKLYYPATLLPPNGTAWLDKAFTNSKKISSDMILQGPLDKFPFDNGEGKFLINSVLRDVDLKYDEEWPEINDINGSMIFSNRSLTIIANSAKILGEPIELTKTTIPNLDIPFLHITGSIKASSSMGLKFLNSCPLKKNIGRKLKNITLDGPMNLDLKIDMPLSDHIADQTTYIKGNIELNDNKIDSEWGFEIDDLNGKLKFNEETLSADNLKGNLFDKPINLSIKTLTPNTNKKDSLTRIKITGKANVRDFEKSFSVEINPFAFGNFNYKAILDLPDSSKPNIFKLSSDLKGVKVSLPEPFNKKRAEDHTFNLTFAFEDKKDTEVDINYNNQINAALKVKKIADDEIKVLAGEIKFGKSPAKIPTTPKVEVTGNIKELDWPTWKKYLSRTVGKTKKDDQTAEQVQLNIGKLHIFGETFKDVLLKIKSKEKGKEISFLTKNIDGTIYLPDDPKEHIQGNFEKIYITTTDQKTPIKFEPHELSPFNLKIKELRYNDKSFKNIILTTETIPHGLKFSKIELGDQNFHVKGYGKWLIEEDEQSTSFNGEINTRNVGNLLKQMKFGNNLYDGKGKAIFSLKWPDALYKPVLKTTSGSCSINVTNGRIINLSKQTENKLGLGRLLNILSLQSLPKRLTLDFSDLSTQGFAFDKLETKIELANENALIKNLSIEGSVATIKAYGKIGLKTKDYNIMLSAAPQLTSSIPIAAGLVGGPVVGVLSFIADQFISHAIKKTAAYKYQITGPWSNPVIRKK